MSWLDSLMEEYTHFRGENGVLILGDARLDMFTKPGDLVLDPFAGYGSIPLVAELFGRRWIGIEIDPVKFEVAKQIISRRRVVDIKKLKETLASRTGKHTPITSFMK
jgi:predicted RNA methylase